MKLAVIITGSSYRHNVGITKIARTRATLLQQCYGYEIDYYYLECKHIKFSILKFLRGDIGISTLMLNERRINLLHKYEFEATNRFNRKFLKHYYNKHKRRIADWEWHQDLGRYVKGYDLITAHFNDAALISYGAYNLYGIPYCVTWHGSDIHTIPFNDEAAKEKTILAMETAACNFFVSDTLLKKSDSLTKNAKKEVIYNSVDECFIRYAEDKRMELRNEYNIVNKKVVTFAGHLIDVKNAGLLPDIFYAISKKYCGNVVFWIIGEGVLYKYISSKIKEYDLTCKMWGFIAPTKMPEFFNCTDVLVLPSKNEGLPLVTIEAIKCGANVVGSNVGGISEVIGIDNVVDINESFVDNFAIKVVEMLNNSTIQYISDKFDWKKIVGFEHNVYSSIIK